MQRRLQLLIDGNYINFREDGKIRLQFLGIKIATPPNMDDAAAGARPFDHGMVTPDIRFQELQHSNDTIHIGRDLLEQNDYWIKPWAIRHTDSRSTMMELDPSKFALSASLSLLNQLQGAYHATKYYNLQSIMTEGIKAGRDLMGNHGSSGRLHSYWGIFPPWDQMNRVTSSKSSVDQWLPMVTLYIPIVDLGRAGGKLTENGVIIWKFGFVYQIPIEDNSTNKWKRSLTTNSRTKFVWIGKGR